MDASLAQLAGAAITAGLGLLGLLAPHAAARFVSLAPVGAIGISELRATYGGFFLGLGGFCLATQHPVALAAAATAWLATAAGRLVSIALDGSRAPKNWGGVVFEGAIGALLLAA